MMEKFRKLLYEIIIYATSYRTLCYIRDAKKIGGQAGGQASARLLSIKRNDSLPVTGRVIVLGSEPISFHREDVALITNVFHIQWKFLEGITRVALEDRYQKT
jgi:hypothetical protein